MSIATYISSKYLKIEMHSPLAIFGIIRYRLLKKDE